MLFLFEHKKKDPTIQVIEYLYKDGNMIYQLFIRCFKI